MEAPPISTVLSSYFTSGKVINEIPGMGGGSFVIASGSKKFVLKNFESEAAVSTEIAINSRLKEKGLPLPGIIANLRGERATRHGRKFYVLYEFCSGRQIGWDSDLARIPKELAGNLARTVAAMHKALAHDAHIKAHHFNQALTAPTQNGFQTVYKEAADELRALGPKKFTTALIHSDLTRENVFVSEGMKEVTGIIDFSDAHYDFVAWDLAVAITQIFITRSWGIDWNGLQFFLERYCRLFALAETERAALLPMIRVRNIQIMADAADGLRLKNKTGMLKSIQSSVETKLVLVDDNEEALRDLFLSL